MAPAPGLRIGDADREAVAAGLREHFADGRLTLEEFQHRIGAVFAARTDRDLDGITSDLPHLAASPGGRLPGSELAGGRAPARGGRAPARGGRASARGGRASAGGGRASAGGAQARAGGRQRRSWLAAVAGLIMIVLAIAVVALLLPVALFGMALSRSVLFVLAVLLFGRRGLLRRLRGWLPLSRRWPF